MIVLVKMAFVAISVFIIILMQIVVADIPEMVTVGFMNVVKNHMMNAMTFIVFMLLIKEPNEIC